MVAQVVAMRKVTILKRDQSLAITNLNLLTRVSSTSVAINT